MAKHDPRADPTSERPAASSDFSVDRVDVPKGVKRASASEDAPDAPTGPSVAPAGTDGGEDAAKADAQGPKKQITSQDPRYESLEKLLDVNDWRKVADDLGPIAEVGKLPPNLGLLAALAHNEAAKNGEPEAAQAAIRCMAGLLGLAEDSPIARVLARRLLRKNPVKLSERKAPPPRTSLLIVLITLVLGGGVGWLASAGSWPAALRMLHLE